MLIYLPSSCISIHKIPDDYVGSITNLQPQQQQEFEQISAPGRQKEYLYSRACCFDLVGPKNTLSKNAFGAPTLQHGFVSISHSNSWIALQHSLDHVCAIDIQTYEPKIDVLAQKFQNTTTDVGFHPKNHTDLNLLWSAKETAFKFYQKGGILFKQHIQVSKTDTYYKGWLLLNVVITKEQSPIELTVGALQTKDFVLTCHIKI